MEYIFEKYRVNGKDFLVFDTVTNQYELSQEKVRRICNHHFGVGISGVIMGPYLKDTENEIEVRMFNRDGSEEEKDPDAIAAFNQSLKDHTYVSDQPYTIKTSNGSFEGIEVNQECSNTQIKQTGKIITADHFIENL